MTTQSEKVSAFAKSHGLVRPQDLAAIGIPRSVLPRMVQNGQLIRISRGLYALPERKSSEYTAFVELSKVHPQLTYCLLSALHIHKLSSQLPHEIWIAIPNKGYAPVSEHWSLRVVRFSGDALTEGVEEHCLEGVTIRVTSVAKTVSDCFKYRNKIGLDVALEALNDAWRNQRVSIDELWHYAGVCRIRNVIRPYLESITL